MTPRQVTPDDPVRNLITRPAVLVHLTDSLRRVAETFVEESIGAAVVKHTHPPALVSERDITRAIAEGAGHEHTLARDVMTEDLVVAGPDDTIRSVVKLMLEHEIRHVPIIEDDVVIGLVSVRDALRVFSQAG